MIAARNLGHVFGPVVAAPAAERPFIAAVQRAAEDQQLTDAARRVHALVWSWLVPREARRIDVDGLALSLGLDVSTVYRALDLLVRGGYLAEGDRVRRERTFRRAA